MKRSWSEIWAYIPLGFVVLFFTLVIFFGWLSSESTPPPNPGYAIEKYDVDMNVGVDNKVDVLETIEVKFTDCDKHGIYRFIPSWLEYTGKNGRTINRKSNVSNVRLKKEIWKKTQKESVSLKDWEEILKGGDYQSLPEYTTNGYVSEIVECDYRGDSDSVSLFNCEQVEVEEDSGKTKIKIGSPYTTVGCGPRTYYIAYTYDMGKDPFKGFDEFIFHTYGDYWDTEIKNATMHITMPKDIEDYNIKFFMDKKQKKEATEFVNYKVNGKTLDARFNYEKYASATFGKKLEKALTVDIELPDGYFEGGSWNYGWNSFIISMVVFLLTILTFFMWLIFGKDYKKRANTIEFYPPDNLDAAEIGYIFNNKQSSKKLTIALIIQLANKGYIKIDDLKDKKVNIQITNLINKPKEPKFYKQKLPLRRIELKKLKDIDDNLSGLETVFLKHLFMKEDKVVLDSEDENMAYFLEMKDKLLNCGYIEILRDNNDEIYSDMERMKERNNKLFKQYSEEMLKYNSALSKLSPLSDLEKIVYDGLFSDNDGVIILSEHKTFYKVFERVADKLKSNYKDKLYEAKSINKMRYAKFICVLVVILNFIAFFVVKDLDPSWGIIRIMSYFCIFINILLAVLMERRTEYGELMNARIKGFRNFLVTAEKSKLEALVLENPNYFYDILPYTYVMNISKKWVQKFENIPVPSYDRGTFDYNNISSYSSLYHDIYVPKSSSSSSSGSSGCSSCGGGCSSCGGGGCSSCGGGGSW